MSEKLYTEAQMKAAIKSAREAGIGEYDSRFGGE